ncbi:MAG: galactose mutarotase [Clostridiales Family XIII bacterium]|jgi:aldose 1-epimerase|nr:galactose mutarotase [Clostridiales Family XIII bacterium]
MKQFLLRNNNGYAVGVTNFGATITNILVPVEGRGAVDVVLGYDSPAGYADGTCYFGATIGRIANRICRGRLPIGGRAYQMDKNDGGAHALHGGASGYDKRVWDVEAVDEDTIALRLLSPDGDQGLPGNADVRVRISLTDNDEVRIDYEAVSDADTVFNLTNHSYFNLDGFDSGGVGRHMLSIDAGYFLPTDAASIPTGELRAVEGTPFDFREAKPIGRDWDADDRQLDLAGGFDHCFALNWQRPAGAPAARAWSEKSKVALEVFTDLPGMQLYTGNYLGDDPGTKGGFRPQWRGAFCLETQHFPDAPNHAGFPSAAYRAGEPFASTTIYRFSHI